MRATISARITGTFGGRVNERAELIDYDVEAVTDLKVETTEQTAGKDPS